MFTRPISAPGGHARCPARVARWAAIAATAWTAVSATTATSALRAAGAAGTGRRARFLRPAAPRARPEDTPAAPVAAARQRPALAAQERGAAWERLAPARARAAPAAPEGVAPAPARAAPARTRHGRHRRGQHRPGRHRRRRSCRGDRWLRWQGRDRTGSIPGRLRGVGRGAGARHLDGPAHVADRRTVQEHEVPDQPVDLAGRRGRRHVAGPPWQRHVEAGEVVRRDLVVLDDPTASAGTQGLRDATW